MKVLMTLMGMEIGGAETHVLELCKALKTKGVDVIVASNGGAYEKELSDFDIKHYKVPLHNKKISSLIKSYYCLKKIIAENKIKLVHAHARIPAFLCGLLQKRLGFRFVTTAHWIFKTVFPFNVLTDWGEKTLSVSNDIKKYLMDNYNVAESDISLTINGIDTNKFSLHTDYEDLISEFKFDITKRHIVCVSRLDKDRSLAAHKLIEIADELYKRHNDIEIIIVGSGNDIEDIKRKASSVNKRLGNVIYITGPRVDINKFLALADVFIGVSRAALEAMAACCPVILAGNEGYIGVFDDSKLTQGIDTNFCCRDCGQISKEKLLSDIEYLLSDADLTTLGQYGNSVIKQYYSVERMADDAIAMYNSVKYLDKSTDVMISGYYGFNNNGDDAVLKAIVDDLKRKRPDITIVVLSHRPIQTQKQYGVESINRINFFAINKRLKQTKLLISGGGSLIQDLTSTHSLLYYLWVIDKAIKNHVRVMLYSNGIGPLLHQHNKSFVRKVLNNVDLITLRDKNSMNVLRDLKVETPEQKVTADAAFNLHFDAQKHFNFGQKYFIISVRSWKYNCDNFEAVIAAFADYVFEKYNLIAVLIPMHPSNDADISKRIISRLKHNAVYFSSHNDILSVISNAEFILAMRLHSIIYAIQTSTPILGLVYDPKVQAIMDEVNQTTYINIRKINLENLQELIETVMTNHLQIRNDLKRVGDALKQKASENTTLALNLLDREIF